MTRAELLSYVLKHPGCHRREICRELGVSLGSICSAVRGSRKYLVGETHEGYRLTPEGLAMAQGFVRLAGSTCACGNSYFNDGTSCGVCRALHQKLF